MKYLTLLSLSSLLVTVLFGCSDSDADIKKNWPKKLQQYDIGLKVTHSSDTVYATLNTKDPETHGNYQMQFTTTVKAIDEDLEIVEFGGYAWVDGAWVFVSIFDRPFNPNEFDDWYGAKNGKIHLGKKYADNDNWLIKSDVLNGRTYRALFYFIAKNKDGKKFVGAKEIVGIMQLKK